MTLGERFATAVAAKDTEALRAILAEDVDFKALTPGRFWEAGSVDEVLEILFGSWFEEHDHVDALASVEVGDVGDTSRVGYRFDLTTPDGPRQVEQQVYFRDDGKQLHYLRVVCSGFRPRT